MTSTAIRTPDLARIHRATASAIRVAVGFVPLAIHGGAACGVAASIALAPAGWQSVLAYALAPFLYVVLLVTAAGTLASTVAHAITPGRFPRDAGNPAYRARMIYCSAWTSIFYCTPVLHAVLSCPPLKAMMFRLFGYRGALDFTVYPDTWMRDLPLLKLGSRAYVSNRATLGTNLVQSDGRILVAGIEIGEGALVGHLAMVGPGCRMGARSELGVGAALGWNVFVDVDAKVGPRSTVHHGSKIGRGAIVGTECCIGRRVVLGPGVHVPDGARIPDGAKVLVQTDVPSVRLFD